MPLASLTRLVTTSAVLGSLFATASAQLVWQQLSPASSPSPRYGHRVAFVYPEYTTLLFGGANGAQDLGDTWSWSGSAWQLRATVGPAPRSLHGLARYDLQDRVLLFGGETAAGALLGDTWMWNGANWNTVATPVAPSARSGHALATDEYIDRRVVLFGGRTAAGLSDETWVFQNGAWSMLATPTRPPAREGHALVSARDGGSFYLYGGRSGATVLGDEWRFDGATWHPLAASGAVPRADHAFHFDGNARFRFQVFGGENGGASAETLERSAPLAGDAHRWFAHATALTPPARTHAQLIGCTDMMQPESFLFGGRDADGQALGDTWRMRPAILPEREPFGTGCGPGPWGPDGPALFAYGASLLGSTMELNVITAEAERRVLLLIGDEGAPLPVGSCGRLVRARETRVLATSSQFPGFHFAVTELELPFEPNLSGSQIALQAVIRDRTQPNGAIYSRGMRLTLAE